MRPNINFPLQNSALIDQNRIAVPPNLAGVLSMEQLSKIYQYMLAEYIWPQIVSRRPYEGIWNMLYKMYRMRLPISELKMRSDQKTFLESMLERQAKDGSGNLAISDTLIFDTVDRLTNLSHFIMWKRGCPIEYQKPQKFMTPLEDRIYHPTELKYRAANCAFEWNAKNQGLFRKTRISAREFWLYGFTYAISDVAYELAGDEQAGLINLTNFGITYEPVSIKKVWVDWTIPISEMESQPCPFYYSHKPKFAILQEPYDPALRPFGYVNLEQVYKNNSPQFLSIGEDAWRKGIQERLQAVGKNWCYVMPPKSQVGANWVFYPMLPLDPQTGEFGVRKDGTPVPMSRFVWEHWGKDIYDAGIVPTRLQHYSWAKELPIYGATHLEDLDSAAYPMSIGEALMDYYIQISTCLNQAIENKDKINNPPTWHVTGSPSINQNVNRADAKIQVTGMNDFGWRQVPNAMGDTVAQSEFLSQRAKTSSKATDALLGQALGDRTTATEAQNIYQTSMSGITVDIDILNDGLMGGLAHRTYDIITSWYDMDLLKLITGQYGLVITKEDKMLSVTLNTNVGTSYVESVVRQNHIRFFMEQAGVVGPQIIDYRVLLRQYAEEIGMPQIREALMDDQYDLQIQKSTEQAIFTYLDKPFIIDPNQDHNIALEVKTRFLEDTDSAWNVEYGNLPYSMIPGLTRKMVIAQQCQVHNNFIIAQQLMMAQQQFASLQTQQETMLQEHGRQMQLKESKAKTKGDQIKASHPNSNA